MVIITDSDLHSLSIHEWNQLSPGPSAPATSVAADRPNATPDDLRLRRSAMNPWSDYPHATGLVARDGPVAL